MDGDTVIIVIVVIISVLIMAYAIPVGLAQYFALCPTEKMKQRAEDQRLDGLAWRLRYDAPTKSEYGYLADVDKYIRDNNNWKSYQAKRLYYVRKILNEIKKQEWTHDKNEMLSACNEYIYKWYITPKEDLSGRELINACDSKFAEDIKDILVQTHLSRVSFEYRYGIDYLPFASPDDESRFTIKIEDMWDVKMDCMNYYNNELVDELLRKRYSK